MPMSTFPILSEWKLEVAIEIKCSYLIGIENNYSFSWPIDAICEIWKQLASCRLKMLTDGRRRMPAYTISSPVSLWPMWAKNQNEILSAGYLENYLS